MRTALAEGVHANRCAHASCDNGANLKATTILAMLHWLGIEPSYSRPRVSDDNSFAEALFRTAKYRPSSPSRICRFGCRQAMGSALRALVQSRAQTIFGLRYVTSDQRLAGQDGPVLIALTRLPDAPAQPQRWSGRPATTPAAPSPSIRSVTSCSAATSQIQLSVRSASLLSRPDLSAQAATRNAGDGGAEPPGTTRRAPWRTSMASTGPSP